MKQAAHQTGTLAEAVDRKAAYYKTVKLARNDPNAVAIIGPQIEATKAVASILPTIRRISYDSSCIDLVAKTDDISTEKIIGALGLVNLPANQFWIEGDHIFTSSLRMSRPL